MKFSDLTKEQKENRDMFISKALSLSMGADPMLIIEEAGKKWDEKNGVEDET